MVCKWELGFGATYLIYTLYRIWYLVSSKIFQMLSDVQIKQLKSENELLQLQLQDVNYMIGIREEELEILRDKAKDAVMLQSQLEGTLDGIGQMQNFIGRKQQEAEGAARREAAMEEEIIQSLNMEKEYYDIKSRFASTSAALIDINSQLSEAAHVYKELAKANTRIAELESSVEIIEEEKEHLAYELVRLKKQNERLQQGFDS